MQMVQTDDLFSFIAGIMEAPMSEQWMPPTFKKYDGSIDPNKHLRTFVNTMAFYTSRDLV